MTAWMIMYSAHVEYGAREKLSSQFSEYVCTSANWDPNKQIEDIKHLQAQGIDLLLIDPLDSALVRDGVEQAARAGLPVILAPTSAQTQQYVSWVATGEAARGSACVEWLVGAMPRGRVVVLQSLPAAGDGAAWLSGVQNALARYPALNVTLLRCAWSSSEAKRIMSAHLCQVGGVDGLIVNNGVLGMGSVQAFLECNQPIPLIAGADDWNGWLRIAKQHAVQFLALNGGANLGLYCVELATQILSGHPVPHRIDIPYVSFDNRELDAYYRPDLSDHYWAMHDLPEAWITRMYKP